jgi:hypothetical protein
MDYTHSERPEWLKTITGQNRAHESPESGSIDHGDPSKMMDSTDVDDVEIYRDIRRKKGIKEPPITKLPTKRVQKMSMEQIIAGVNYITMVVRYDGTVIPTTKEDLKRYKKAIKKGMYYVFKMRNDMTVPFEVMQSRFNNALKQLPPQLHNAVKLNMPEFSSQLGEKTIEIDYDEKRADIGGDPDLFRGKTGKKVVTLLEPVGRLKFQRDQYTSPLQPTTNGNEEAYDPQNFYEDGTPIHGNLPGNYQLAANPANQGCQNCLYYSLDPNNAGWGACSLWNAPVNGKYVCQRWVPG